MNKGDVTYTDWTKEALIDKIRKLECHVNQLRNVIAKSKSCKGSCKEEEEHLNGELPNKRSKLEGEEEEADQINKARKKKRQRPFDFSQARMQHVVLKILYLGWDYQGLAVQEDTNETIEAHLFRALSKTKLIEDRTKSNYHRCGRTDKGVSSFCQVISIDLRSKVVDGKETVDYCKILNKTLPKDIRVIAWSPVRPEFSARFNCFRRTYKYFFPKGSLDIEKMKKGAEYLVGEHDFRNFCKLDKTKNLTTTRRIISVDIQRGDNEKDSKYEVYQLIIHGQSFIWHQIRCIVGILLLIGEGLEEPEVVQHLLDLQKFPHKPQYTMATDYPLVLYDVGYPETEGIKWQYTTENMTVLCGEMQALWMKSAIQGEITRAMRTDIERQTLVRPEAVMTETLITGSKRKVYVKLMDRPVCEGN